MTKSPINTKIIAVFFIIAACATLTFLFFKSDYFDYSNAGVVTKGLSIAKEPLPSVFKEVLQPVYLPPQTIAFNGKILEIESVGVEEGGFLGVPSGWHMAGWYKNSAKAGDEGNVVIDGHYDTNTGAPAAFWELKDLQVGDKVSLTDSLGRSFDYLIRDKFYIDTFDPERTEVFNSSKDKILTLITCGGIWDYTNGTYNKRLVIKAEFDKMEKSW